MVFLGNIQDTSFKQSDSSKKIHLRNPDQSRTTIAFLLVIQSADTAPNMKTIRNCPNGGTEVRLTGSSGDQEIDESLKIGVGKVSSVKYEPFKELKNRSVFTFSSNDPPYCVTTTATCVPSGDQIG